jgi:methylated-DNA-[protein]-cysteine S-methyltransferase
MTGWFSQTLNHQSLRNRPPRQRLRRKILQVFGPAPHAKLPTRMSLSYTLFDTAIGRCGLAWGPRGIVAVQLPQPNEAQTRTRLLQRASGAVEEVPPAAVAHAIASMVALLQGERRDLTTVELDLSCVPEFNRRVYAIAREIPPGATLTYGDIARRLGAVALSRDVGQALGQNPCPIIVPCHRVLAAGGRPGGFSASSGAATKLRMLAIEGAYVNYTPSLFDEPPRDARRDRGTS